MTLEDFLLQPLTFPQEIFPGSTRQEGVCMCVCPGIYLDVISWEQISFPLLGSEIGL